MAETATSIRVSGRTSETCREAGPYRSSRNANVIVFFKPGDRFPSDADDQQTTWQLVTEDNDRALTET